MDRVPKTVWSLLKGEKTLLRPPMVDDAVRFAESLGFKNSCLNEVGELLHLLSGHIRTGKIAEIGTGCGVGTAWIATATALDVYTVDNNQDRVLGTQELFSTIPNVHPIHGNWDEILQHGPFQLIYVDAKSAKLEGADKVVHATAVGGLIVIDDLTPMEFWPDEWKGRPDLVRDTWLHHNELVSVEIRTSLKSSAILARRVC